jgi:hypothetical protein
MYTLFCSRVEIGMSAGTISELFDITATDSCFKTKHIAIISSQ